MSKKQFTAILAGVLAVVMVAGLLGSLAGSVNAASSSEIQNQIDQLEQQKADLEKQMAVLEENLAHNRKDIQSMIAQKTGLDQQIALLHAQITLAQQTITAYNLMIADTQDELDTAEKKLALLHEAYKSRIRAMEEQGEISYWSVIFEANSFFEMLDHLNMAAEIARADRKRLDEIRKVSQQVEQARSQLLEKKQEVEAERQALEASEKDLLLKKAQADGVMLDLLSKGDEYFNEMDAAEKSQQDLMDDLAELKEDKIWAEYLEWLATSVPPTTITTAPPTTLPPTTVPPTTLPPTTVPKPTEPKPTEPKPTEPKPTEPKPTEPKPTVPQPTVPTKPSVPYINGIPGKLVDGYYWYVPLPLDSYWVSSEFGYRTHPVTGQIDSYHKGIDMAAPEGTPIYAVRDGVVRVATSAWDAGFYVSLGHVGGYISVYMHMTHYIVKPGDRVVAGQIIGYVGSTGQSTGNHLHFGIAKDGTYMNPRLFLDL